VLLSNGKVAGEGTLPELRERAGMPTVLADPQDLERCSSHSRKIAL